MKPISRRELLLGALSLAAAPPLSAATPPRFDPDRVYHNAISGESARIVSASPAAVRFEWIVQPGGGIVLEHEHPVQEEVFEILDGELSFLQGGQWRAHSAGEVIRVPRGVDHKACNPGTSPARAVVSLEPGLDALPALLVFWGMCDDGLLDPWGRPDPVTIAALTSHFQCCPRPAGVPDSVYPLSGLALAALQARPAYRALYRRYTGLELS